ncbi:pol-like protein ENS-3 [Alligator mississippiensis]|uniref:ribonuclease H n=1 Tax=Alligator mississippiensis TaxID=8496 RepID=A0A151P133_ALLMI|nr:pol-like protein ENS-3 [Alligator mississippiensis]
MQPIQDINQQLEDQTIIRTHSPYNNLVWLVHKPNGEWRLTIDFRTLNANTDHLTAPVPSMPALTENIRCYGPQWMGFMDIKDMFFAIPVHEDHWSLLAFTWLGQQYTYRVLSWGWVHSPTLAHGVLAAVVQEVQLSHPKVHVWQYVNDVMVGGQARELTICAFESLKEKVQAFGFTLSTKRSKKLGPSVNSWESNGNKVEPPYWLKSCRAW